MSGPGTTVAEGGLDLGLADGELPRSRRSSLAPWSIKGRRTGWDRGRSTCSPAPRSPTRPAPPSTSRRTTRSIRRRRGDAERPVRQPGQVRRGRRRHATWSPPFDNEGQVEISSGTWELSGDGTSAGTFTVDAGASLELNMYYGIPYTVNRMEGFSSPQIIGGNASNVTLIDGSDSLPKPLGNNEEIPCDAVYVLLRRDRRRHGRQPGHDRWLAERSPGR